MKTDSHLCTSAQAPVRSKTRPKTKFARTKKRFALRAIFLRSLPLCLAVTLFPLSPFTPSRQVLAQNTQRTVDGRVDDKAGAAIPGAIVYLKDIKTLSVKTFICGSDGKFHFGQLSQNADYELWAELNGKHSKTRHISSFASQNKFNFSLALDM